MGKRLWITLLFILATSSLLSCIDERNKYSLTKGGCRTIVRHNSHMACCCIGNSEEFQTGQSIETIPSLPRLVQGVEISYKREIPLYYFKPRIISTFYQPLNTIRLLI